MASRSPLVDRLTQLLMNPTTQVVLLLALYWFFSERLELVQSFGFLPALAILAVGTFMSLGNMRLLGIPVCIAGLYLVLSTVNIGSSLCGCVPQIAP